MLAAITRSALELTQNATNLVIFEKNPKRVAFFKIRYRRWSGFLRLPPYLVQGSKK